MKRLILLLILLPSIVWAQNTTTLPAGTSAFTPQWRYKGVTPDSLNQLWMYNPLTAKYNQVYTATQANLRFALAGSGAIYTAGYGLNLSGFQFKVDTTFIPTNNRYLYGLDTLYNKNTYSLHLLGINNVSVPTPANGVNIFGDAFANSFGFKGANGNAALFNTAFLTGSNVYRLPDYSSGTLALINGGQTFSSANMGANIVYRTPAGTAGTDSIAVKLSGGKLGAIAASGYVLKSDSNNVDNNYVTYWKYTNGTTTQYNKSFVDPTFFGANATHLNITGTGGVGSIFLAPQSLSSVSIPVSGVNFFGGSNFIAFKNTSAIEASFNSSSLLTNRAYDLPNASGTLALTSDLGSYVAKSDSGNVANNYVTYGKLISGATTQYNKTFINAIFRSSSTATPPVTIQTDGASLAGYPLYIEQAGANTNSGGNIVMRSARGTIASPTQLTSGNVGGIYGAAYNDIGAYNAPSAAVRFTTNGSQTSTNGSMNIVFETANSGSLTRLTRGYIAGDGKWIIGSTGSTAGNENLQVTGNASISTSLLLGTLLTMTTAPTTSAGTYDILTRNASTGVVEKIASTGLATVGQTTLVSGTNAITISGLTTGSKGFVTLVTPTGVTLTTSYQAVCTANTLTIQANVAAGTINVADGSVVNYQVYQ